MPQSSSNPQPQNETQQQSEQQVAPEQQENSEQTRPQEVDENDREQSPFNQKEQQILNKLRSDPYRVLRYRLQQQARQQ